MSVPTRTQWKALKKACGVPDGAVSGVDVGKALDAYHAKLKAGVQHALNNAAAASALEKTLVSYISKIDKKKVKDFGKLQSEFVGKYAGEARKMADDFKRYSADRETYKKEIMSFINLTQRFEPGKTTATELQKFKSGPLRGLSAVGSGLRCPDIDPKPIDEIAAKIQAVIDKSQGAAPDVLERIRAAIAAGAVEIAKRAKAQNII